jgi:hypothetical protein
VLDLPTSITNLERLIESQTQESLHLDYKRSQAIDNSKRAEITKDVSAFANSDGGLIIYGVVEEEHLPVRLDSGTDHTQYTREWLEQVINSGIAPRVDGVRIVQIALSEERSFYAVQVPKSYRGPHQASNKRYYKRFNFQSVPMEHYEIDDVRNRRHVLPPLLNVDVEIKHGVLTYLIVENIGELPARDVRFQFADPFVWRRNEEPPPLLTRGAKLIPPGRVYRFFYHPYPEIINNESVPSTIDVEVDYLHSLTNERVTDTFHLDFADYFRAAVVETELYERGKAMEKVIEKLVREVGNLNAKLDVLSSIAGSTGVDISVRSLENLRHLLAQDGQIEKIDSGSAGYRVFQDVLGVDIQVALRLQSFFEHPDTDKRLEDIEGVTEEVVQKVRRYFVIQTGNA